MSSGAGAGGWGLVLVLLLRLRSGEWWLVLDDADAGGKEDKEL